MDIQSPPRTSSPLALAVAVLTVSGATLGACRATGSTAPVAQAPSSASHRPDAPTATPDPPTPSPAPTPAPARCDGWESMEAPEPESGLVVGDDGRVHRPTAVTCASSLPGRDGGVVRGGRGRAEGERCERDTECSLRAYGRCDAANQLGRGACVYGCVTDADCGAGKLCVCGDPVGRCAPATCRTDADCGAGQLCARHFPQAPGYGAFACTTARDACSFDCDCDSADGARRICLHQEGARACVVGGRPVH